MTQTENKPVARVKSGKIIASIWKKTGEQGTRFNVAFTRLYTTAEGEWKNATSFGRDELLLLAKVADLAHSKIDELLAADKVEEALDDTE